MTTKLSEALKHLAAMKYPSPSKLLARDGYKMEAAAIDAVLAAFEPTDETPEETANAYRAAAKDEYVSEGAIEIDSDAIVSSSLLGAYVAAWVWVDASDAGICRECGATNADNGEGWDGLCGNCADAREARVEKIRKRNAAAKRA
jgi:hypothetical protein